MNVNDFNIALDKMMTHFEELFAFLSKKAISPPNRIETNKKIINGRSYLYSQNDPAKPTFQEFMQKYVIIIKQI